MLLKIYHNTRIFSGEEADRFYKFDLEDAFEAKTPITVKRSQLKLVAEYGPNELGRKDSESELENAYYLTQSLRGPWWENEDIKLLAEPKQRSTSVGDVIEHAGAFHMVATFGFYPITVEEDAATPQTA